MYLYYAQHECILMSPGLSISIWIILASSLYLSVHSHSHSETLDSHSPSSGYLIVQFQYTRIMVSNYQRVTSQETTVLTTMECLYIAPFAYNLPDLAHLQKFLTYFGKVISYICNIFRFFFHILHSDLVSLDLLNDFLF